MESWGTFLLALSLMHSFNVVLASLELSSESNNGIDVPTVTFGSKGCTTVCSCVSSPSISYCCPGGVPDRTKCGTDASLSFEDYGYVYSSPCRNAVRPSVFYTLGCQIVQPDTRLPAKTTGTAGICYSDLDCPGEVCCNNNYCSTNGECVAMKEPMSQPSVTGCSSDRDCQHPDICCITLRHCTTLNMCANTLFSGRRLYRVNQWEGYSGYRK